MDYGGTSARTGSRPRRLATVALVLPVLLGLGACTGDGNGAPADEPQETGPEGVINPAGAFTDEQRFLYGQPVLSKSGTGSGSYALPELTAGQSVTVTASCAGADVVEIATDEPFLHTETSCDNPAGGFAHQEVESAAAEQRITVDAGAGAYWLNVFIVDPAEPMLSEAGTAEAQARQRWSLEAVEPQGVEVARLIEKVTDGTLTVDVDVEPGLYRWAGSCRNGPDTVFTVSADSDAPGASLNCWNETGAGVAHSTVQVSEPTTLRMSAQVNAQEGQSADVTLVLARAAQR